MKKSDEIQNEIKHLAPGMTDAPRQMPYTVPDEYFERFPLTTLQAAQTAPAFEVPTGYFDNFATGMLQKVRSLTIIEELEEIAPTLNGIEKTMPHSLPEGYFDNWKPLLASQQTQPAKVIKMGAGNWKQWVAAAAVVFTMGIGWQFLINKPSDDRVASIVSDATIDTMLNKVDANSLAGYLEAEQANSEFASLLMLAQQDVETGVKQLSDDELNWYLENYAIVTPGT
jgi:hypothetical protein